MGLIYVVLAVVFTVVLLTAIKKICLFLSEKMEISKAEENEIVWVRKYDIVQINVLFNESFI